MEDFHGCPIIEGTKDSDAHVLYQSNFRVIVTYAMALKDLEVQVKRALLKKGCLVVEKDKDGGDGGTFDVTTPKNSRVHVSMRLCGLVHDQAITQLTYSRDF